jgi:FKBP-type peptidyl-prolyl cis-trans isomerase (trigger factor)
MYELSMAPGEGTPAEFGDAIVYSATVYLLDDSGVGQYTDTVELGRSEMEIGLHESLKGMKKGEKKLVLIPSFLARGLAGDLDKVPPQSPLRYDIRLIQVGR